MINVLICDDNREYAAYIQSLFETVVSKSEFGDLVYNCKCFSDSALALRYCQKTTVHVALLDIDMPEVDGFQLALAMQDKAFVIFISAFEELVYASFSCRPFRFIRKTHIQKELPEALLSALEELLDEEGFIILKKRYQNEKLFLSEIMYCESKRNYVELFLKDGSTRTHRATLIDLVPQWEKYGFCRIHAGFVVNMRQIKYFHHDEVEMKDGKRLPMSRKYWETFRQRYQKYMRG